jgi:hypothetical protein
MYYLLDLERTILTGCPYYWKPNKRGYTHRITEAGEYTAEEASYIVRSDHDKRTVILDAGAVKMLNDKASKGIL